MATIIYCILPKGFEDKQMVSLRYTRKVGFKREKHSREAKGGTYCYLSYRCEKMCCNNLLMISKDNLITSTTTNDII